MSITNITLPFGLLESVNIIELERNGIIKSIWICETGVKYQVRYFDNAKIGENYFYDFELNGVKK